MILSIQIADVGVRSALRLLATRLERGDLPGLLYAEITTMLPMSGRLLELPNPGRVGLIAGWRDAAALDRFLDSDPTAERLASGWHVRLEPVRLAGAWSAIPELPLEETPVDDDEPVAVLTLGRLKLSAPCASCAPAPGRSVSRSATTRCLRRACSRDRRGWSRPSRCGGRPTPCEPTRTAGPTPHTVGQSRLTERGRSTTSRRSSAADPSRRREAGTVASRCGLR